MDELVQVDANEEDQVDSSLAFQAIPIPGPLTTSTFAFQYKEGFQAIHQILHKFQVDLTDRELKAFLIASLLRGNALLNFIGEINKC